ncbi:unnamed protein product [Rotaria sp. Silwood1]|nr:unnamed protein product [Rotaria sp. Silwood1]CAF1616717.1 unnamed protein product [Rotaria sp. Silwood1]CAF3765202.1 unnamed protein product [Rotaria sp. Silwood1]CAF5140265.1 unnamed protein product [Rotaria sp. Silwood1]
MIISVIFWSGFAFIPGHLRSTNIEHLSITTAYKPTISNRSWFINPSNLDIKYIFIALPFGLLVTALFYFDHNISSLTAQAKHYPLRKPAGFHWDFFLLGCTTIIAGFLGLPYPNALVPQCAMHTDALVKIKEQRLTNTCQSLLCLITMTGPFLKCYSLISRAVLADVFIGIGWDSVEVNTITYRLLHLIRDLNHMKLDDLLLRLSPAVGFPILVLL